MSGIRPRIARLGLVMLAAYLVLLLGATYWQVVRAEEIANDPDTNARRIDLEEQLAKALSLLRELRLDGQKELSRTRLEARVAELTTLLAGEGLSEEDLNGFYAELQEIQSVLAARDAERRLRVPASFNRQRRRR